MNKLLLATALLTALSAPALAAYPKGESDVAVQHVGAMREYHAARDMLPRRAVGRSRTRIGPLAIIPTTGAQTAATSPLAPLGPLN